MADLDRALDALGNRGYRAAQLEAGIVAGRLQVGAFALGWGATASTFYDDDSAVAATQVTPSVLLVDDDAVTLSRFRQHLRTWEARWDLKFALGAEEALEALDSTPFDVVVSDVQTRGLDGESLLEAVQARHGSLVRVALARHPGEEAALRASAVAHRFLTKPLDDDE